MPKSIPFPVDASRSASPSPAGDRRAESPRNDRIWIAWERQRRSLSLSQRLDARLVLRLDENRGWLRYPVSIAATIALLWRRRGATILVQNPSMVLAALACLLKKAFGYALVVDRHSNFGFLAGKNAGLKRRLSDLLSAYTLRHADLTIVTNVELRQHVDRAGGRGYVLPDPFPDPGEFREAQNRVETPARQASAPAAGPRRPLEVLFVSSWAFDEPIAETIEACRMLKDEVVVRISGSPKPAHARLLARAPENFQPTGFVSDSDYFALMARSDAVMAVTSRAATLVCGGYEAVAMGKPLLLGNSETLRDYFRFGCLYTDGTAADIGHQLRKLAAGLPDLRKGVERLYAMRSAEWEERLDNLESILDALKPRPLKSRR